MTEHTYKAAGVNLDAAQGIKQRIKEIVTPTHGQQVLGGVGAFGAMYQLAGYREPVLVSSTDGVGTKLLIAKMMNKYDTIGEDLVNACVNDVIVSGAKPLFFLDYIAVGKLDEAVIEALLEGMARACSEVGCALIGGETAQMPGLYAEDDFDMAGFAVGVVEKSEMLDSSSVTEGDVLLGIPSNGLQTNGYSLVRHILGLDDDPSPLSKHHDELGQTMGEALLTPHPSFYSAIMPTIPHVKAISHITGGGLIENVPRTLPDEMSARFDTSTWKVPPIFTILQEMSSVSREEMYRVFNMGLGMVIVCDKSKAADVMALSPDARIVGEVSRDDGEGRVVL